MLSGGVAVFISILGAYLPYTFVTGFTPGPNNIIALYAISQQGWQQGRKVILGIAAGFISVMLVCALFCYELARYAPAITGGLKYLGAAYIVYLATQIACSKPSASQSYQISFWKAFFLQFANVKIILFAITAHTVYTIPYEGDLTQILLHSLCMSIVGIAGTLTWATAGGILQSFLQKHYRPFNITMALILLYCAVSMFI